jgi:ankyrin repeat protein
MHASQYSALLLLPLLAGVPEAGAPVADAAEKRDWAAVAALVERRVDVNSAQPDGSTALHWAVYHDDAATVTKLLHAGANANAVNRFGVPPLAAACTNGSGAIVAALLKAGANARTTLRGGETVLMVAARTGRVAPVKALIAGGADVNAKDRNGQDALMWAAAEGHAEAGRVLLGAGAQVIARTPGGFTPLLFAARDGRIDAVRSLLKAGADANEAIQVKKPLPRGPKAGSSALHLAVENGHFELALELVDAGANPNDQRCGHAPLHMISWVRQPSRGDDDAGQPPPLGSGRLTSLAFVRRLVALGADVNLRQNKGVEGRGVLNRPGATPLLAAASTSDVPLVKALIDLGADAKLANADGTTPLLAAAGVGVGAPEEAAGSESEALLVVSLLIRRGADVNAVDKNDETAMHGAAYRNHPKMVRLLAEKGAIISKWNRPNKAGLTPLVIAEGHRPGLNFRPSPESVAALHQVMRAAGVEPPERRPIPDDLTKPAEGEKKTPR